MATWQWMGKFLVLLLLSPLTICFQFFPENGFLRAPVTQEEIDLLHKETLVEKGDDNAKLFSKSDIPGRVLSKEEEDAINEFYAQVSSLTRGEEKKRSSYKHNCFDMSRTGRIITYRTKSGGQCIHTADTILRVFSYHRKDLEDVTGRYFNGQTYIVTSYQMIGDNVHSITLKAQVPVPLFSKLALQGSSSQPSIMKLDFGDMSYRDWSFQRVGITVTGKCRIKQGSRTLPYDIETEIEKPADSSVYEIKKFDLTGQAVRWLDLIGQTAAFLGIDKLDIVNKIGETLGGFTGFGAFNNDQDYQFGIVADGNIIRSIGGAKKLTILFSQSHLEGRPTITFFLEFDEETQLIDGIRNLIGNSGGIDPSFMFNKVSSEKWCVLVVTGETTYLDPVKTRLSECLGSEKDTIDTGLHFYVELNFQAILLACGNTAEEIRDVDTQVGIYATINRGGVSISVPNGVDSPLSVLVKCGGAMAKKLPEFLGTSMVKLTDVDMNVQETLFKFGVEVELSRKYRTIPGTSITINKFKLLAERKKNEDTNQKYWDISASGNIGIGQATFDLSIDKTEDTYSLQLSVDQFMLSDLFSTFNVLGDSEILQKPVFETLGIKDFAVKWTFGGGPMELNIKGTPLISDYDNLHFNTIIQTGGSSGSSGRSSSGPKFALAVFMDGANFDSIIEKFFGPSQISLCWLSGLKAVVIVSTASGKVTNGKSKRKAHRKLKRSLAQYSTSMYSDTDNHVGSDVIRHRSSVPDEVGSGTGDLTENGIADHLGSGSGNHDGSNTVNQISTAYNQGSGGVSSQIVGETAGEVSARADETTDGEEGDDGLELTFPTLGDDFADTTFDAGLAFTVVWRIPRGTRECGSNDLCKWLVSNLGSRFAFILKGNFGRNGITISGSLEGYIVLKKTEDENELAFTGVKLVIEIPRIRLEAKMVYKDKTLGAWDRPLTFTGSIEASPIGIKMSFSMKNFIYPTPLTKYVAIGDIRLSLGYTVGAPLPSFSFGVALKLGKLDPTTTNSGAISLSGYFGFDPVQPGENWFQASVSSLTVGQICSAFELQCHGIAPAFLESGFPNGLSASFSAIDREVEPVGSIPAGLVIKGSINFLGYECIFDVEVSYTAFKLDIEMPAINWLGGLIRISRSTTDDENGPKAKIEFSSDGEFSMHIEGSCRFLGLIRQYVNIQVDNSNLKFEIDVAFLGGLLDMNVKVESRYGSTGPFSFKFVGNLKSNLELQETLKEWMQNFLTDAKAKVEEVRIEARNIADRVHRGVEVIKQTVNGMTGRVGTWKTSLERRRDELNEQASSSCNCPDVCFKFLKWNYQCRKSWWDTWMGCLQTDYCYSMVRDVKCYINCWASQAYSKAKKLVMQAAAEIGIFLADVTIGLGNAINGVLTFAQTLTGIGKAVIDKVFQSVTIGLTFLNVGLTFVSEVFILHHFKISASVEGYTAGCFAYDISLRFVEDIAFSGRGCFDAKSILLELAKAILAGPSAPAKLKDGKGGNMFMIPQEYLDLKEGFASVEKVEQDVKAKIDEVTTKINTEVNKAIPSASSRHDIDSLKGWGRQLHNSSAVPSKEETEILQHIHQSIPAYVASEDPEMRSVDAHVPWTVVDVNGQPFGYNATVSHAQDREVIKMNFDNKLNPCERMKRALTGYSHLADGLATHANLLKDAVSSIKAERNSDREQLRSFRSEIEKRHNMTTEERENAYYAYTKLAEGYKELAKKSDIILNREDSFALPVIRRQLNDVLKKRENGSTFLQFTEHMHENALTGYKRSNVPHADDGKGEALLTSIKQELQSIVTDEHNPLTSMSNRIDGVKRSIIAMEPYTKRCEVYKTVP